MVADMAKNDRVPTVIKTPNDERLEWDVDGFEEGYGEGVAGGMIG
jgi:hypothetical protein